MHILIARLLVHIFLTKQVFYWYWNIFKLLFLRESVLQFIMLVITEIIHQVKDIFDEIFKWNPYPLKLYFPLNCDNSFNCYIGNILENSQPGATTQNASYKFEANKKTSSNNWINLGSVLVITWIACLYQIIYEDDVFVAFAFHLAVELAILASLLFIYTYHFHLASFLNYFNELLLFEVRHVNLNFKREQTYWKKSVCVNWPRLGIQIQW